MVKETRRELLGDRVAGQPVGVIGEIGGAIPHHKVAEFIGSGRCSGGFADQLGRTRVSHIKDMKNACGRAVGIAPITDIGVLALYRQPQSGAISRRHGGSARTEGRKRTRKPIGARLWFYRQRCRSKWHERCS